eukprot:1323282-Rhodomonas_salina.1
MAVGEGNELHLVVKGAESFAHLPWENVGACRRPLPPLYERRARPLEREPEDEEPGGAEHVAGPPHGHGHKRGLALHQCQD